MAIETLHTRRKPLIFIETLDSFLNVLFEDSHQNMFPTCIFYGNGRKASFPDTTSCHFQKSLFHRLHIHEFAHDFHYRIGATFRNEAITLHTHPVTRSKPAGIMLFESPLSFPFFESS